VIHRNEPQKTVDLRWVAQLISIRVSETVHIDNTDNCLVLRTVYVQMKRMQRLQAPFRDIELLKTIPRPLY